MRPKLSASNQRITQLRLFAVPVNFVYDFGVTTMLRYLLIVTVVAQAGANAVRSKRSFVPLADSSIYTFVNQFRQTLLHIIATKFNETEPLAAQLKADMAVCSVSITARKAACKACAKNACKADFGDMIVFYLEKAGEPFVDFGNMVADWKGWDDMANWFEGAGKDFVSWEGWDDMGSFFEDIGKGFVDWSGWHTLENIGLDILNGLEDFGKDFVDFWKDLFRRKRALGENMTVRELLLLYRALENVYSRADTIDPEVKKCMQKCSSCDAFLKPTTEEMVNDICGPEVLQLNNTVFSTMTMLVKQFNRCNDTANPIVRGLSYDPTSLDMSDPANLKYTSTRIDAMCTNGYTEYASAEAYQLMSPINTAALMAKEYYQKNC